jgi:hypothetical protein
LRLIAYRSFGDGIEFQIVRQRAGGAEYSLLLLVVLTLYRHHEEGAAGTRPAWHRFWLDGRAIVHRARAR